MVHIRSEFKYILKSSQLCTRASLAVVAQTPPRNQHRPAPPLLQLGQFDAIVAMGSTSSALAEGSRGGDESRYEIPWPGSKCFWRTITSRYANRPRAELSMGHVYVVEQEVKLALNNTRARRVGLQYRGLDSADYFSIVPRYM